MEFELKTLIPATPQQVYDAWMSTDGHAGMTGAEAEIHPKVGEPFSAWNGYITGQNLALEPGQRIVQTWRTTEFAETDADSHIEVILEAKNGYTELTLIHTRLPAHGEQYKNGWQNHYFVPMQAYFAPHS